MEGERIKMDTERYLQVLAEIDRLLESDREVILVAIDGRCASGKTTLGNYLKQHYDCNLFHMDDFFLSHTNGRRKGSASPAAIWIGNVSSRKFCSR